VRRVPAADAALSCFFVATPAVIETIDLTKVYPGGVTAVDGMNLTVAGARSSACWDPTAPARRTPPAC